MITNKAKILGATVIAAAAVGALGYGQYQNTKQIAKIESNPVVITHTVVVTPTIEPTATPSATIKRIYTPATVTKGVK